MSKKKTYKVLSAGIQVRQEYGDKRFLKGEEIKLNPEHPLTIAFLKGHMIEPVKEPESKKPQKRK
jgi:hypothetical protein